MMSRYKIILSLRVKVWGENTLSHFQDCWVASTCLIVLHQQACAHIMQQEFHSSSSIFALACNELGGVEFRQGSALAVLCNGHSVGKRNAVQHWLVLSVYERCQSLVGGGGSPGFSSSPMLLASWPWREIPALNVPQTLCNDTTRK